MQVITTSRGAHSTRPCCTKFDYLISCAYTPACHATKSCKKGCKRLDHASLKGSYYDKGESTGH